MELVVVLGMVDEGVLDISMEELAMAVMNMVMLIFLVNWEVEQRVPLSHLDM